jgi:hypothetical protein
MADDIAPEGSAPHGLRGMRVSNRVQPEPAASPGHLRDADELPSSPEEPSSEPEELGLQSQVGRHDSMGDAVEDIRVLSKVKIFASAMKQHGDLAFLRPESLIPMTLSPPSILFVTTPSLSPDSSRMFFVMRHAGFVQAPNVSLPSVLGEGAVDSGS